MKWFVGVDGGGSKTDFAIASADAVLVTMLRLGGCSYQSMGVEAAVDLISDGVQQCLLRMGATITECAGCCVGLPCYGENVKIDHRIVELLQVALSPMPIIVVNDVEVGWAGSLECGEGIHIVSGTGAIAFGRGSDQRSARCGGWNEFFGDEGSSYWVGRQAMSIFSKQADGRLPRGPLYELIRQELAFTDDYQFADIVLRDYATHRQKVAAFQLYAERAARAGDVTVQALYTAAAEELVLLVQALKARLTFSASTAVSYSGGLFKAGELILKPFRHGVEQLGCTLHPATSSAVEGAILLAIEHFNGRIQ